MPDPINTTDSVNGASAWSDGASFADFITSGDSNRNGGVSVAEFKAGLANGSLRNDDLKTALRQAADSDGDGTVESAEYGALETALATFVGNASPSGAQEFTAASLEAALAGEGDFQTRLSGLFARAPNESAGSDAVAEQPEGDSGVESGGCGNDAPVESGETVADAQGEATEPATDVVDQEPAEAASGETGDATGEVADMPADPVQGGEQVDGGEQVEADDTSGLTTDDLNAFVGRPLTEVIAGLVTAGVEEIRSGTPDSMFTMDYIPGRATVIYNAQTNVVSVAIEGGARSDVGAAKPNSEIADVADWLNGGTTEGADASDVSDIADWLNGGETASNGQTIAEGEPAATDAAPDPAVVRDLIADLSAALDALPAGAPVTDAQQDALARIVNGIVDEIDANDDGQFSAAELNVGLSLSNLSAAQLQDLLNEAAG